MRDFLDLITRQISRLLNVWVLAGALATACFFSAVTLAVLGIGRSDHPPAIQSTAILKIVPAIMITPSMPGTGAAPGEPGQTVPAPPSATISLGSYVQVIGTGGTGLRLRAQPGLNSDVLLLASETEVFQVDDGPVELDGYTWWHLVGPFEATRQGWAVTNYLETVQNP